MNCYCVHVVLCQGPQHVGQVLDLVALEVVPPRPALHVLFCLEIGQLFASCNPSFSYALTYAPSLSEEEKEDRPLLPGLKLSSIITTIQKGPANLNSVYLFVL